MDYLFCLTCSTSHLQYDCERVNVLLLNYQYDTLTNWIQLVRFFQQVPAGVMDLFGHNPLEKYRKALLKPLPILGFSCVFS